VLANAASVGAAPLELIVAVGNRARGVIPPCGRCRQVLLDFQPGVRVVTVVGTGELRAVPVVELLPGAYVWEQQRPPAGQRNAPPDI